MPGPVFSTPGGLSILVFLTRSHKFRIVKLEEAIKMAANREAVELPPQGNTPANTPKTTTSSGPGTVEPSPNTASDEALVKSIVRKYDVRILPLIFLAWVLFYLDRAAIALTRVNGMEADLRLTGAQFNISLMLFFAMYVIFNIPGNLLLRKVGGGRFLPCIVLAWGLVTTFSGFVTDFATLCVTRVLLGLSESAFLGVVMLYLTFFYTEFEIVSRVGLFYSGNALAGAFGGFLATGLSKIRFRRYNGWPWIFFVEGIITVLVGLVMVVVLPNKPQTAKFLSTEERVIAVERMLSVNRRQENPHRPSADRESRKTIARGRVDEAGQPIVRSDRLTLAVARRAILNPVTVMLVLATFMTLVALNSFSLFLPTLILAMGHTGIKLNLMTVPPNLVAFVFVIAATQYSQLSGRKAVPMLVAGVVATAGYLLLLVGSRVGREEDVMGPGGPRMSAAAGAVQYAGTFLVAIGVNVIPPIALAWTCINASPHYVRALVLGALTTFGNTSAFVSSFTYIKTEAPR